MNKDYEHKVAFYELIQKQIGNSRKVYRRDEIEHKIKTILREKLNKLSYLCPLCSKEAREVALKSLEIFKFIGAPCILQIDNGREFVARIIRELKLIWKDMVIVHGKPRHPQSQGSIERANADVKKYVVYVDERQ
ncbi:unnamed protein product [Brachionus calyciflorus]|uniref:Integrase catalytic domain-containing protein n=1 Tax=Brachionus calyciflorus TaxID=104777 RepID=A0A813UKH0_9BILA|nr:unnamed protein product [Brachionus calyciflorus]